MALIVRDCRSLRRRWPSYGGFRDAFQEINFREFETFPDGVRGAASL
ncbi:MULTISPECIES: hypothetical protein [unclassified Afipia]|nr:MULTISPECIES: hypothetical protein [unclassified Afipia]